MESSKKTDIFFFLQTPPPVHGSNLMNQYIREIIVEKGDSRYTFHSVSWSDGVEKIGVFKFEKVKFMFLNMMALHRSITSIKPEYVFIQPFIKGLPLFRECIFAFIARLHGKQLVYHLHVTGIKQYGRLKRYDIIYRFFFRNAKLILLSRRLYDDVRKYVKPDDVFYLKNGIQIDALPATSILDQSRAPARLLYVANLQASKGVFELLEIVKSVCPRTDFKTVLVGGETTEITRQTIQRHIDELGIADYVEYAGAVYGDEKYSLFRNCDLFVYPTLQDCFPIVLMEAMYFSLPIVAYDVGAVSDMVIDGVNGYITERGDQVTFSEKLVRLIDDSALRRRMGMAGQRAYEKEFSLDVYRENFQQTIGALSQKSKPR